MHNVMREQPPMTRLRGIQESVISEMTRVGDEACAIDLSQGMPDFDSPPRLLQAAVRAIQGGDNQYSFPFGTLPLRQAVAARYARYNHIAAAEVNQCTFSHVPPIPEDSDEPIPIGEMCDNAEGLVVDEDDQAVSPGQVGELLVRAPTMMRGYWGRPELNQKVFYRRSIFSDYEVVFLRTGDLVRLRQDGKNYDSLGRKDRQIKTRGYRVELDEIETASPASAQWG